MLKLEAVRYALTVECDDRGFAEAVGRDLRHRSPETVVMIAQDVPDEAGGDGGPVRLVVMTAEPEELTAAAATLAGLVVESELS